MRDKVRRASSLSASQAEPRTPSVYTVRLQASESNVSCGVCRRIIKRSRVDEGTPPLGPGWGFLRNLRGRGERKRERVETRFIGKMCSVPPTHSMPRGRKGKEFLVDFFPPVSCFLPPLPSYLSCSHLAAAIHHRISEPFKAQCAGMRAFRKASIIGFREVARSLLNLLDSPSLVQAACTMERQGKEERRRGEKKKSPETWENTATQGGQRSNARQITSFWFCFCSFHLVWMHVFMRWAPLEGDNKGDAACRTGDPKAGGTMWPSWLPWYHEMPVKKICFK